MAIEYLWTVSEEEQPPFGSTLIPMMTFSVRNLQEWDKLAKWVVNHKLFSHNVRWLIQVPRLYEVYKGTGAIENFGDIVRSKSMFPPWPLVRC